MQNFSQFGKYLTDNLNPIPTDCVLRNKNSPLVIYHNGKHITIQRKHLMKQGMMIITLFPE